MSNPPRSRANPPLDPTKLDLARARRKESTPSEKLAWELVRARRFHGLKFRREHPIGGFFADLYCAELRLCIEIDGEVHDDPEQAAQDAHKTDSLQRMGLRVIRIPAANFGLAALESVIKPLL